jgi:hypothetical protein
MNKVNITYVRPNAKSKRNNDLYNDYMSMRNEGVSYDIAMYKLCDKYGISRTRTAQLISNANKKLKNSKK